MIVLIYIIFVKHMCFSLYLFYPISLPYLQTPLKLTINSKTLQHEKIPSLLAAHSFNRNMPNQKCYQHIQGFSQK